MIKKIISIFLFLLVYKFSYCQSDNTRSCSVGFNYFKTTDNSRKYIIGHDTVNRPMLIHFWYPIHNNHELNCMSFRDYIDLIAIREDFEKKQQDIDKITEGFIDAYLGFAKLKFGIDTLVTTKEVLNSPVKATYNAKPINDKFPLIIYAPSNSKSSVQNHLMCEYLASNGYNVISVGSAGYETLQRDDELKATLAQVDDMEFLVKFIKDSLKIDYSDIGLLGFSSGSMATVIYQIKNPEVKAIVSLDGSQEYSSYFNLTKIESFDLEKANKPYLMFANNYKDFSIFPYYCSISTSDKYLFKMTSLDHNGFISYWQQFDMCSNNGHLNSISESYNILCDCVNRFFNTTLKSGTLESNGFQIQISKLIQKDSTDYGIMTELLNQILQEGIESSIIKMKSNEVLYKGKANMINIAGRMFIGYDNDIATKIFLANTEIHPVSWESFYNLAYSYKEGNQLDSAKAAITRAKNMNKDNGDIQILYDEIMKMDEE